MFGTIGQILGLQPPRHAEENDTRQNIQRHDPDFERRKKKKQKSPEELMAGESGATVSVTALEAFLKTFLKELSDKPKKGFNDSSMQNGQENISTTQAPQTDKKHITGKAAHAVGTYQHIAESQNRTSILGDVNENNADMISLDSAEVRLIHTLLDDLKLLKDKNIEYIHIERAESFLLSLVNAVETIKRSDLFKS